MPFYTHFTFSLFHINQQPLHICCFLSYTKGIVFNVHNEGGKQMAYTSATDQTKQNIMTAFWQLYEKGGMSQVSVTKICKKAGYNRSTFYAHFKDVYDVLATIEAQLFSPDLIKGELLLPMIHCHDPKLLLEGILKLFDQLSPYLIVLLGEYGDPRFRKKLLDTLSPALYNSFASTSYTKTQLHYIFEYQNAAIISTIVSWYQNGKDIPKEELVALLITLSQHGIKNTLMG